MHQLINALVKTEMYNSVTKFTNTKRIHICLPEIIDD